MYNPAVADFKELLECGVPLSQAVMQVSRTFIGCTVGELFDAAEQAGYKGIVPERVSKPKDGTACPECDCRATWESSEGPEVLYCRKCLEHYPMPT